MKFFLPDKPNITIFPYISWLTSQYDQWPPNIHVNLIFPELKTLEWNIFHPDRLINLEINNIRRTRII